jgi:5-methylcytosine-specific restriction endonuclease McrA
MSLQHPTLVLNASYEPINIVTARRAIKLVMKGAAYVELASAHVIRTVVAGIPVPSVVRLLVYRKMPRLNRSVSRKSIMLRDRYTCQYCNSSLAPKLLTLDHVVPRSKGGAGTWENLVAACYVCNNRKADRTPAEAGMPLIRKPAPFGIHAKHRLMIGDESAWDKYLFC